MGDGDASQPERPISSVFDVDRHGRLNTGARSQRLSEAEARALPSRIVREALRAVGVNSRPRVARDEGLASAISALEAQACAWA